MKGEPTDEGDIEEQLREVRDLTEKNYRMLRAMRRNGLIRSIIFYTILGVSLWYTYKFYASVQNTINKVSEGAQDAQEALENLRELGNIGGVIFGSSSDSDE